MVKKILVKTSAIFIRISLYSKKFFLRRVFCRQHTEIFVIVEGMIPVRLQKILLTLFWVVAGVVLYMKGAKSIASLNEHGTEGRFLQYGILLFAYILGELKARFILKKSVEREPLPKDFLVLAAMMSLGMLSSQLPLPLPLRALMQLTVGFALIRGTLIRCRYWMSTTHSVIEK